jgi:hypothetical protein
MVHEYGHAVHDAQVALAADQYGWPVDAPEPTVADWDSVSFTSTTPHCLRRLGTNRVLEDRIGEVHFDGTIWSAALWDLRQRYVALGLTTRDWDTTLVESQFGYAPDTSFGDAAKATYQTALNRDVRRAADAVRAGFAARHITF